MSNYKSILYLYICKYVCMYSGHSSKNASATFRIHDTTWGGNFCCFSDAFNFAIPSSVSGTTFSKWLCTKPKSWNYAALHTYLGHRATREDHVTHSRHATWQLLPLRLILFTTIEREIWETCTKAMVLPWGWLIRYYIHISAYTPSDTAHWAIHAIIMDSTTEREIERDRGHNQPIVDAYIIKDPTMPVNLLPDNSVLFIFQ